MARVLEPDIIITDIKMPVMDGIELIKNIKNEGMDTRFLVLSSYNDFKYVKEAMKYGADEYLLKLQLEPDNLVKTLKILVNKLEKERKENKKREIIEKYYDVGIPLVREKFFKDLLFKEGIKNDEIELQKKFLNINLPEQNLICLVLHVEKNEAHQKYTDEKLSLLNDSIITILDGVVSKYGCGYAVKTETMEFTIIYSLKEIFDERSVYEHINLLANNIRQSMSTYTNTAVYIGVSNIHQGYDSIRLAYKQAVKAVNKASVYTNKSLLRFSELEVLSEDMNYKELLAELAELETHLNENDAEKADQILENIKKGIAQSKYISKEYLSRICSVIFFIVNSFAQKHNITFDAITNGQTPLLSEIEDFTTLNQYMDWINNLQKEVINELTENSSQKSIIVKAKRFIQSHFIEDISLNTVADHLSLSPGYLSILFKKETGQNFIDYLIELRMEKAKELLRTTELKIYEISKKVGYENIYYFSRIFSKVVGVSPKQYQNNFKNVQKK
ncbi:MAG: helix-turn-helix domain-containing protein [Clostridiaceae bacterium]|nr:helix-turn-helix domain-containing protein [Clostridiaceae bacterium]